MFAACVEPVPEPADAQIFQFGAYSAGHAGGVRAMGNAALIAGLIAQGRGGLDPDGACVSAGAGQ